MIIPNRFPLMLKLANALNRIVILRKLLCSWRQNIHYDNKNNKYIEDKNTLIHKI